MDYQARTRIEDECRRLSSMFAYNLDQRAYSDVAALFAENGQWNRHGKLLVGRDAIVEALNQRPLNQFTRHLTINVHFHEVSAGDARATVYNISYFSFSEAPLPQPFLPENALLLDFEDRYVKTPDGWKFAERNISTIFKSPTLIK